MERQTTPTDGLYPIAQWAIGEVVRDDQIMLLPADWKAGSVVLELERGGVRVGEWRLTIEGG
ncbi:MAG: hypothetical protein HY259_07800 [Chloroflexi bacterium]|nr:hypothetical protein [Chloroflexota bacterium]